MRITLRQRKMAQKLASLITTLGDEHGMSTKQIVEHLKNESTGSRTKARSK